MDLSYGISAEIDLYGRGELSSYISSYTTGDEIRGVVVFEPSYNVRFDDIQISFIGEQNAHKDYHQFLNIVQFLSVEEEILHRNQKYLFDFIFQVPDILPQSSCIHTSAAAIVKAAHIRPPPSFGDATTSGFGGKLRDDFAPTGCQISYFIQFQVNRFNSLSRRGEPLFMKRQKLRIKPALDGNLMGSHPDLVRNEYCLPRGVKTIYATGKRQNRAESVLGQFSVSIDEPIRIWLPSRDPHLLISQTARLTLFYQPCNSGSNSAATTLPPELQSFESQIVATTFFTGGTDATNGVCYQPLAKREFLGQPMNFYDKRFPPFLREIPRTLRWDYQAETGAYTASLQVPVTLPRENFIPTFHSCLISRVYALKCKVKLKGGSGVINLIVPLIISAKRNSAALPSYDASIAG
ncbi:hypothetical protein BJX62DRAFT_244389 [Aspergillus germanicus]